jgi:hypothetical protein
LHDQRLCVLRRTGGPGFLCRGLQICEALRRLRRHHVVTSIEWSGQWFPSEIQRRPDCRSTLPVLKQSWFNRCATEQARLLAPPALTRAIGTPFLARDDSSEMSHRCVSSCGTNARGNIRLNDYADRRHVNLRVHEPRELATLNQAKEDSCPSSTDEINADRPVSLTPASLFPLAV